MLDPRKDKFKQFALTIPSAMHVIKRDYGLDIIIERQNCTSDETIRLTRYEAIELVRKLQEHTEYR